MISLLTVAVVGPAVTVLVAIFAVLWRERRSPLTSWTAAASGVVLGTWLATASVLAVRGSFLPPETPSIPPVGFALLVALVGMAVSLTASASLRSLLTNQRNLIRLNLWRLEGLVFLVLMWKGRVPALWALPAGVGDVIVGITAPWVANRLDRPGGTRRAIIFNLLGMLDLVVAVGLGVMTNPGPAQVFVTTPSAELLTHFPLVLVPTFLVPLAFMVHVVSLWQLLGGSWISRVAGAAVMPPHGVRARHPANEEQW